MFKKISIVGIALFLFGGSTFAFAWWDSLETSDDNITIGVGEGVTLEASTEDTLGDDVLVPSNVVQKTNDVNETVFTYTVELDRGEEVTSDLDLTISVDNIKVGGENADDFVNIEYVETVENFTVTGQSIEIKVSLADVNENNEPDYDIQSKDITFDVTFTATIKD